MSVTNKIGLAVSKSTFWARKNSPELLVAGSIISAGAAVFLAIKATTKLETTIKPHNHIIGDIKEKMNDEELIINKEFDVEKGKKELTRAYGKLAWDVTKLYLPTVVALTFTTAGILGSHKIMKGRNLALAAAYKTLDSTFASYRQRVADKYGDQVEHDIMRNKTSDDTSTVATKDGKEVVTKKSNGAGTNEVGFNYIFDASNGDWTKNTRANVDMLLGREKYLNQRFLSKGYLFLSDVYEALGVYDNMMSKEQLRASHIIGWVYDTQSDHHMGDNYISFGLADELGNLKPHVYDAIRNGDRDLVLEFNPDGDILTKSSINPFIKHTK